MESNGEACIGILIGTGGEIHVTFMCKRRAELDQVECEGEH